MIILKVKISKSNGTNFSETDEFGLINIYLQELFSQLNIYLRRKLISPPNITYPYRLYIETLLNYVSIEKEPHLTSAL